MAPSVASNASGGSNTFDVNGMKIVKQGTRDTTSTTSSITDKSYSSEGELYDTENGLYCSRLLEVKHRRRWEIHDDILETIGQTPIIRLKRLSPPGIEIYVKDESCNPSGTSKARMAMALIEWGEKSGKLQPGQTVIDDSMGGAGIGLAMVCAVKGYPFVCTMCESHAVEKRKIMRYYGAKVILTKREYHTTGAIMKAQELVAEHGFFYPKQYENEANAWIHEHTTGAEIARAFAKSNAPLDHFFTSYGTGGTVLGVSRALRKSRMGTQIHLCEPVQAAMLSSGIETKYPEEGAGKSTTFDRSHPAWSPHELQGWAPDFIPKLVAMAKEEHAYKTVSKVATPAAMKVSRDLARQEGIFTGMNGGGILAAALTFAQTCAKGTTILCILPDTAERYISTVLFDGIPDGMSSVCEELNATTKGAAPPMPRGLHGILPSNTDQLFDL